MRCCSDLKSRMSQILQGNTCSSVAMVVCDNGVGELCGYSGTDGKIQAGGCMRQNPNSWSRHPKYCNGDHITPCEIILRNN